MRYASLAIIFVYTMFKSDCKSTNKNPTSKNYFASFTKICTFAIKLSKNTQRIE